jgi:putative addiction module CopG family antidote
MTMKHDDANALVITLPADQLQRLSALVDSGQYASRDEIVRDALQLWEERQALASIDEQYLRSEYEAGLASGKPVAVSIPELVSAFKSAMHVKG